MSSKRPHRKMGTNKGLNLKSNHIILLAKHLRFWTLMSRNFFLWEISNIDKSTMEMSMKQRTTNLQFQVIMALICQCQGWQGNGTCTLVAIAWPIVPIFQYFGREPSCVTLKWLEAWVVMELKKVVMVFVDELLWMYCFLWQLLFVSWFLTTIIPRIVGLHIALPLRIDHRHVWRGNGIPPS